MLLKKGRLQSWTLFGSFLRKVPRGSHAECVVSLRGSTNKDNETLKRFQIFTSHSLSFFVSDSLNATPKRMLYKKNTQRKEKEKI